MNYFYKENKNWFRKYELIYYGEIESWMLELFLEKPWFEIGEKFTLWNVDGNKERESNGCKYVLAGEIHYRYYWEIDIANLSYRREQLIHELVNRLNYKELTEC